MQTSQLVAPRRPGRHRPPLIEPQTDLETLACPDPAPPCRHILGMRVDGTCYESAVERMVRWAQGAESRYVCESPVHMVMESFDNADYRAVINGADLVVPGGMPIVWSLRALGLSGQQRVYGPELMVRACGVAAERGVPVGFYGGSPMAVAKLVQTMKERYPNLEIAYAHSPPFRVLTREEKKKVREEIVDSGCRLLFVGLGCPKQERWMAEHKGMLPVTMMGVGAGFDFISGEKPQAYPWMQRCGLEWFFRLITEPRRLWFRYLYHNPRFAILMMGQLLSSYRNRTQNGAACQRRREP